MRPGLAAKDVSSAHGASYVPRFGAPVRICHLIPIQGSGSIQLERELVLRLRHAMPLHCIFFAREHSSLRICDVGRDSVR